MFVFPARGWGACVVFGQAVRSFLSLGGERGGSAATKYRASPASPKPRAPGVETVEARFVKQRSKVCSVEFVTSWPAGLSTV